MLEDGGLVGIFTEKDMLNRVLAKGRGPDTTLVEEVMTPSPDTVLSTMTVLEALQEVRVRVRVGEHRSHFEMESDVPLCSSPFPQQYSDVVVFS